MKTNEGYLPGVSVFPCQGLNTIDPTSMADSHYTPSCLNMLFNKGVVKKRRGYREMGSELDGTVMEIITFEVEGLVKTVAITTTKEYVWDIGGGDWSDITAMVGDRTGSTSDVIQWVVGTDQSGTWLYITNGKDAPRRWDGVAGEFEVPTINIPGFVTCKTLAVFQDSLVLANFDDGTLEPKTLIWSDTINFNEFTAGNAGSQLIPEADGEILTLKLLADRLCVYTRDSLYLVTFVGGTVIYTVERAVSGTRLLSSRSVVNIGPFHVWAGEENAYLFDGSRQIQPQGDAVQAGYREDLALDSAQAALSFYDSIETQVYTVLPTTTSGESIIYVNELLLTDYAQHRWSRLQFDKSPNAIGYFINDTTLTWDDLLTLGITWEEWSSAWNDNTRKVGFPVMVLGSGSQVYLYDGLVYGDNGEDVEAWIDTTDFTIPAGQPGVYESQLGRWLEVEIELRGTQVQVQYSIDKGANYMNVDGSDVDGFAAGVQTLSTAWTRYRFFMDVTSQTLRIRLYDKSQSQWFERRWLKVWVQPQGGY